MKHERMEAERMEAEKATDVVNAHGSHNQKAHGHRKGKGVGKKGAKAMGLGRAKRTSKKKKGAKPTTSEKSRGKASMRTSRQIAKNRGKRKLPK